MNTVRDSDIRAAIAAKETQDTRIAQKVMAAHREAFVLRFPGAIEHCLRLVTERLLHCLIKPDGLELRQPSTWPATPDDILCLARALESVWQVHQAQVGRDR